MNKRHVPQPRTVASPSLAEGPSRWGIVRDLGVFELKLAVDGLKDLILAPLALAAAVADMVIQAESRGVFLRSVMRIGERFDRWLNLYGARRGRDVRSVLDEGGSDVIVDYLESTALDRRPRPQRPQAKGPRRLTAAAAFETDVLESTRIGILPYSSIWAPSSMTRFGGSLKKSVAPSEFRDMRANSRILQAGILLLPPAISFSRPRK